jgi:hypothetical protein
MQRASFVTGGEHGGCHMTGVRTTFMLEKLRRTSQRRRLLRLLHVSLSASGAPTGASASLSPASVAGSGTSTLTFSPGSAAAGT